MSADDAARALGWRPVPGEIVRDTDFNKWCVVAQAPRSIGGADDFICFPVADDGSWYLDRYGEFAPQAPRIRWLADLRPDIPGT